MGEWRVEIQDRPNPAGSVGMGHGNSSENGIGAAEHSLSWKEILVYLSFG